MSTRLDTTSPHRMLPQTISSKLLPTDTESGLTKKEIAMKQLVKFFQNLLAAMFWAAITVAVFYHFFPKVYAVAAYSTGLLPVTQKIKEAAPDLYFAYQERLLEKGETLLKEKRDQLSANRGRVQEKLAEYQDKIKKIERLINQARAIYQANPAANEYRFIGKRYTPEAFSAQILVLGGQKKASEQAIAKLDHARTEIDKAWVAIAQKDSELSSDRARLETARILWETDHLLGDLRVETDLSDIEEMGDYTLRTVDELLKDAANLESAETAPAPTQAHEGLSPEALAILGITQ